MLALHPDLLPEEQQQVDTMDEGGGAHALWTAKDRLAPLYISPSHKMERGHAQFDSAALPSRRRWQSSELSWRPSSS